MIILSYYIPLWFNLTLLTMSILLVCFTFYSLIVKSYKWFVILPLFAYGLHSFMFYSFISFAQLTDHLLSMETMTLWSAILRLQGLTTSLVMMIIITLTFGKKCNG